MKYTPRQFINKVFGRVERLFTAPRLRIFKTIYVNFRSLPFSQAIHFPIYVYGKLRIYSLNGSMEIKGPIRRGMIKIGMPRYGSVVDVERTYINNKGRVVFNGEAIFCNGVTINVIGGELMLGDKAFFAEKARIVCSHYIEIGEGTRIAHECQIIDTNFHYILNVENGITTYPKGKIKIGKWSWVANRTTIQKGTVLPDYTIVGSNSLLNKDYSDVPPCSLLAGMPAKFIKTGLRRVFNIKNERMLHAFFEKNGYDVKYRYLGDDIDEFCQ